MTKPRGVNWLTSLGFVALGAGYLWESMRRSDNPRIPGPTPQELEGLRRSRRSLGAGPQGAPMVVRDGVRTVKLHPAGSIDNRVRFIVDQIRKDSIDKKTITEARAIVSGKCRVERGGLDWCVPVKSWTDELRMLYYAITNPNSPYAVRYTRDHATVDLFGSSDLMRRLPAEDCFVHGTLVLRDDHRLVPVETLRVGDRIWGLDKWTTVQQTWDKGVLPTWLIRLNNGSTMRLTPDHKVWTLECEKHPSGSNCTQTTCPLEGRTKKIVRVRDLTPKMMLIQPERVEAGGDMIDAEEAWIEGVFAADGWIDKNNRNRFGIAGKDGCPKEEQKRRVQAFFAARGIKTTWHRRYIHVYSREWVERLSAMGQGAPNKRLRSLAYNADAVVQLSEGVMADAGTDTRDSRTRCLTTTSRELLTQMRVLMKIRGKTCSTRYIENHGGLGKNPIWRLQERVPAAEKTKGAKQLRVKEIIQDNLELPCFDFATEDQNIWLPEADWTVHNCDGLAVRLGALCRAIGYAVKCRVVAPAGQPNQWAHIYIMVGDEPGNPNPRRWLALDASEPQHPPFWEVPKRLISTVKDFDV